MAVGSIEHRFNDSWGFLFGSTEGETATAAGAGAPAPSGTGGAAIAVASVGGAGVNTEVADGAIAVEIRATTAGDAPTAGANVEAPSAEPPNLAKQVSSWIENYCGARAILDNGQASAVIMCEALRVWYLSPSDVEAAQRSFTAILPLHSEAITLEQRTEFISDLLTQLAYTLDHTSSYQRLFLARFFEALVFRALAVGIDTEPKKAQLQREFELVIDALRGFTRDNDLLVLTRWLSYYDPHKQSIADYLLVRANLPSSTSYTTGTQLFDALKAPVSAAHHQKFFSESVEVLTFQVPLTPWSSLMHIAGTAAPGGAGAGASDAAAAAARAEVAAGTGLAHPDDALFEARQASALHLRGDSRSIAAPEISPVFFEECDEAMLAHYLPLSRVMAAENLQTLFDLIPETEKSLFLMAILRLEHFNLNLSAILGLGAPLLPKATDNLFNAELFVFMFNLWHRFRPTADSKLRKLSPSLLEFLSSGYKLKVVLFAALLLGQFVFPPELKLASRDTYLRLLSLLGYWNPSQSLFSAIDLAEPIYETDIALIPTLAALGNQPLDFFCKFLAAHFLGDTTHAETIMNALRPWQTKSISQQQVYYRGIIRRGFLDANLALIPGLFSKAGSRENPHLAPRSPIIPSLLVPPSKFSKALAAHIHDKNPSKLQELQASLITQYGARTAHTLLRAFLEYFACYPALLPSESRATTVTGSTMFLTPSPFNSHLALAAAPIPASALPIEGIYFCIEQTDAALREASGFCSWPNLSYRLGPWGIGSLCLATAAGFVTSLILNPSENTPFRTALAILAYVATAVAAALFGTRVILPYRQTPLSKGRLLMAMDTYASSLDAPRPHHYYLRSLNMGLWAFAGVCIAGTILAEVLLERFKNEHGRNYATYTPAQINELETYLLFSLVGIFASLFFGTLALAVSAVTLAFRRRVEPDLFACRGAHPRSATARWGTGDGERTAGLLATADSRGLGGVGAAGSVNDGGSVP